MSRETDIGGVGRTFEATLWTVVLRAKEYSKEALEELLRTYWKPAYFYVRRRGVPVEEAKDLTQGFFAKMVERDFLKSVSREKGKFRTFVLTALNNFLSDEAERRRARKRGGGRTTVALNFGGAETEFSHEPAAKDSLDHYFKRQWALAVLNRALEALAREMSADVFEDLKPHLAGGGPMYAVTALKMNISETKLNNLIHSVRKRYRRLLKEEVAASVTDPSEVDGELKELFDALKS